MGDLVSKGWFEDFPKDWDVFRMKNIMNPKEGRSETGEEELLSVTINRGVVKRTEYLEDEEGGSRSETLVGYKLVEPDDLVNNIMKMSFRCLGVSQHSGIVSPAYSVFELHQHRVSPKFINYLLRTDRYVYEYRKLSKGIQESRMRLYDDFFLSMKVIVPPLEQQQLISRYLDKKTEKIDSLIEKIQRKIELLKEQRTSLINQCVTKGLDPTVEMKDSGVEWIGEIPSHWDTKKMKYVSTISLGKMLDQKKTKGILKPYLGGTNILDDSFDLSVMKEMFFTEEDEKKYQILKNDIFVLEGGDIGRTSIWEEDTPNFYFQKSLNRVRVVTGVPRYIFYSLKTIYDLGYYDKIVERVSIPHLTSEKLFEIKIPFPPSEEQELICNHLLDQLLRLDQKYELEERKIGLIKEYRQSLISSVVTGKVRVTEDMV